LTIAAEVLRQPFIRRYPGRDRTSPPWARVDPFASAHRYRSSRHRGLRNRGP